MAKYSAAELQEQLARDLPGTLALPAPRPAPAGNNAEPPAARSPAKKGEAAPVDLLATSDTLIQAEHVPAVAHYLRERLGYALLSNITATDYLSDQLIEVVYHFFHPDGGPALVIKVRVPRAEPVIPSLTPSWPGAALQEREAYDLYGVRFPGHPNLKRIYMWDEFEGFPMRKDFPRQGDKYIGEEAGDNA